MLWVTCVLLRLRCCKFAGDVCAYSMTPASIIPLFSRFKLINCANSIKLSAKVTYVLVFCYSSICFLHVYLWRCTHIHNILLLPEFLQWKWTVPAIMGKQLFVSCLHPLKLKCFSLLSAEKVSINYIDAEPSSNNMKSDYIYSTNVCKSKQPLKWI